MSDSILDSGMSCDQAGGDWGQNEGKFLDGVKELGMACHDGHAYYLVGATGSYQGGSPFKDVDTNDYGAFPPLPGVITMDGKAWGGISGEDIIFGFVILFPFSPISSLALESTNHRLTAARLTKQLHQYLRRQR